MLYAVEELPLEAGASAVALRFEPGSGDIALLARVEAVGDCPCHVSLDRQGRRLFVSNYVSGNLLTCALDAAGLPTGAAVNLQRRGSGPNESRQEGPHVHQAMATPDGSRVLVCDAGTDEIAVHAIGGATLIDPQPDLVVKTKAEPARAGFHVLGPGCRDAVLVEPHRAAAHETVCLPGPLGVAQPAVYAPPAVPDPVQGSLALGSLGQHRGSVLLIGALHRRNRRIKRRLSNKDPG